MLRSLMLLSIVALPVAAQSTGMPVFQAPYHAFTGSEVAFTFSDPGPGFALEASYRSQFNGDIDGGIRGGLFDGGFRRSGGILLGGDFRMRVIDNSDAFPLDGSLTFGLGLASSENATSGYLPVGLTLGRRVLVENSPVTIVPYAHVVLTPMFGDASGTAFTLGFGADVKVNPRLEFRISSGLGDRDGLSLSVALLR